MCFYSFFNLLIALYCCVNPIQSASSKLTTHSKSLAKIYEHVFSYGFRSSQGWLRKTNAPDGDYFFATVISPSREIDEDKVRNIRESYFLPSKTEEARQFSNMIPVPCGNIELAPYSLFDMSPSGNWTLISKVKDESSILEVSGSGSNDVTYKIDMSKVHGKVIGDAWFGGCSWTGDEKFVAYVACTKESKKVSYFAENDASSTPGSLFEAVDDWGEKYTGISTLSIFVLELRTGKVFTIPAPESSTVNKWTVGQPSWRPFHQDSSDLGGNPIKYILAYTAWVTPPNRLGMIYCYNRPCSIFAVDLTSTLTEDTVTDVTDNNHPVESCQSPALHVCLTGGLHTARSPRFTPDGTSLLCLGRETGSLTHDSCSQLFRVKIDYKGVGIRTHGEGTKDDKQEPTISVEATDVIVDIVDVPSTSMWDGGFPGLFCDTLPKQCFLSQRGDGVGVIVESMWGVQSVALVVELSTGIISKLGNLTDILRQPTLCIKQEGCDVTVSAESNLGSASILDILPNESATDNTRVLYQVSTPADPPTIGVAVIQRNTLGRYEALPISKRAKSNPSLVSALKPTVGSQSLSTS